MLCRKKSCVDVGGSIPVYLNVYDITPFNGYAYWLGLGVYHSGIQVHGVEYAYGAHEYPSTGIFEGEPKKCQGFLFRKSILVGWTDLMPDQVAKLMEDLAFHYKGNAYNLITKNCNHFCNDASIRLTTNPIPTWVNRLARIGSLCNCVIPATITTTRFRHHAKDEKLVKDESEAAATDNNNNDNKKIASNTKMTSSTTSSSNSSSSFSSSPSQNKTNTITTPIDSNTNTTSITNSSRNSNSNSNSNSNRSRSRRRTSLTPSSPLILPSPTPTNSS